MVAAVALIAVISVGASLAFITDTGSKTNIATVGNLDIELLEYERISTETKNEDAAVQEFNDGKLLVPAVIKQDFNYTPGDANVDWEQIGKDGYTSQIWDPANINNELDKMVFVKNSGHIGAYIRNYFAFEAGSYTSFETFKEKIHLNLNETDWTWEWVSYLADIDGTKYFIASATYNKVLEGGKITEISLSQIALDSSATSEEVTAFSDDYTILVFTQGVQETGFENAAEALENGFGSDIPFENIVIDNGIKLKTALNYLNGDSQGTQITDKVTSVVFGLNEDHPEVVNNNEGTLISDEQDARVFAYYVENGTNYDVYFLADDAIYTPKDSTELFRDMTALASVDTANMDVSRTENMTGMFRKCSALPTLDVSGWDVSNVKSMKQMFLNCHKLNTLDVSGWNLSNVTTLTRMFYACSELPYLNVSDWDVSNVTNMTAMFFQCIKLNNLDVSDWDVSSVSTMDYMFQSCDGLTSLDVSNWDVSNVTTFQQFLQASQSQSGGMKLESIDVSKWDTSSAVNMAWMFYGCSNLKELDLSGWDVSKVTTMYHMFADCFSLEKINFEGWDTSSLENMDGIFNTCYSLKVIDVSDFDTQNVTDMDQVFNGCYELEEIIGLDKWDTSNVLCMNEMFGTVAGYPKNSRLQVIDLSSFDTSKVTDMRDMFQNNPDLVTIYVGDGWDTTNVTNSANMFNKCPQLAGGNGTTIITGDDGNAIVDKTYACVDTPETPGYLTYKGNANP